MTAPVHDPDLRSETDDLDGIAGATSTADADNAVAPSHWRTPLIAGAAAACGCVAIALVNPTDSGVPICWSQAVFGVDCPLCGGLRATNALMRGQFGTAADHNVVVAIALPVVAAVWLVWVVAHMIGRPFRLPRVPRWLIGVAAVAVLVFTVARNVGGPTWVDWLASTTYR